MTTPEQITALALTTYHFLLPHLDYIRGKVADSALTESGKALVTVLKDKWLAKNPTAQAALADAAANPSDPDNRDTVLTQLRKALKADPALAQEIAHLASAAGLQLTITGDHNKTAIVQGDGNSVNIH
jgi:hypothetical protein